MGNSFEVVARCEAKNVEPGKGTLWASINIEPRGKALEADRAPLAIALVLDVSGSMQGDPIGHALQSCAMVAELLSPRDRLAIVTFADQAAILSGLVAMDEAGRAAIRGALRDVRADGQTNLHGGLGVAAGVLLQAPAGLRRVAVVMSDGQPNVGLSSPSQLAGYVKTLGVAVSALGFGLSHDENVLEAIATAGSGRYTYIADPRVARIELARAALAHGGIVADHLELRLRPALGVELVQILPPTQLRVGAFGLACTVGDVFVDEPRSLAVELQLDVATGANGRLAEIEVAGIGADGAPHQANAALVVDIRAGARVADVPAQRDILLVRADVARIAARAQADRGALPAAVVILRDMAKLIDALPGFVRDDGSLLAELREQLEDEIANYERKSTDVERGHQRKAAVAIHRGTPMYMPAQKAPPTIAAVLIRLEHGVAKERRALASENTIGRVNGNDFVVASSALSKRHARIVFTNGEYVLVDLGSTNGTYLNGMQVHTATTLHHGDMIAIGSAAFRFELGVP
jgi:Ca-activated chloride channel family protein